MSSRFYAGGGGGGGSGGGGSGPYPVPPTAPFVVPSIGDFSTSLLPAEVTATGDPYGFVLTDDGSAAAAPRWGFVYQAPPSAPYTITTAIDYVYAGGVGGAAGITFRNSATGNMTTFCAGFDGFLYYSRRGAGVRVHGTLVTSTAVAATGFRGNRPNWFRVVNDGTNLTWYLSANGLEWWNTANGETLASFVGAADQIGISIAASASGATFYGTYCRVASWEVV